MAEIGIGTKFYADVAGFGRVELEVTALKAGGMVELTGPTGKQDVSARLLMPEAFGGFSMATAPVIGLQPDPPMGIARVAENTSAVVLPSPVAPETVKIFNPLFELKV